MRYRWYREIIRERGYSMRVGFDMNECGCPIRSDKEDK